MKILIVSPEAGSWDLPSSLVEAVDNLALGYNRQGHEVRVYSPFFASKQASGLLTPVQTLVEPLSGQVASILHQPNDLYWHVEHAGYFARDGLYNDGASIPFPDNHLRFCFLASSSLMHALSQGFLPDIIHCQEWGGGITAALARTHYAEKLGTVTTLLTIHNARYDFHCLESDIERIGLDRRDFGLDGYEFWGKVSLLKAGIFYADAVSFTSPGYSHAIMQGEMPGGIRGFLEFNAGKIHGVQSGLDYRVWSAQPQERAVSRRKLQLALGLQERVEPLLVYCHVDGESGKVAETLSTIMSNILAMDLQLVIGLSRTGWESDFFPMVAQQNPGMVAVLDAHQQPQGVLLAALSAADVLLVSGLEEPSGSLLLKSLAKGVLPVSDRTGGGLGLLRGYDGFNAATANAFLSDEPWPDQILRTLRLALEVRTEVPSVWDQMCTNARAQRVEWDDTARHYLSIAASIRLP